MSDPHELPELDVAKYAANENLLSQFRAYQKRAITFHSEPLAHATEIAGNMRLNLLVQSDAPDFDLWAEVLMVLPDGSAVKLGEDIRRARFRNSYFKNELLKPDQSSRFRSSSTAWPQIPAVEPGCSPHCASQFTQLPEELQHRRPYRLRKTGRHSCCVHQGVP